MNGRGHYVAWRGTWLLDIILDLKHYKRVRCSTAKTAESELMPKYVNKYTWPHCIA